MSELHSLEKIVHSLQKLDSTATTNQPKGTIANITTPIQESKITKQLPFISYAICNHYNLLPAAAMLCKMFEGVALTL